MTPLRRIVATTAGAAAFAFLAMAVQDLGATAMVIAEAHYSALAAALLDQVQWMAATVCTLVGVGDVIRKGHLTRRAKVVLGAISAGNLVGTYIGVMVLGHLVAH